MPVRRFRSVAAMPEPARAPGDPRLFPAVRALWRRSGLLAPYRPRPGVRKFRSIEDANADREQQLAARVRELRQGRG